MQEVVVGFINGSHASGGFNIMYPDVRHVGLLIYVLPVIIAGKKRDAISN